MKVKNIMFSGFAAAIFAGACGAADAAAVSLISKDYADTKLQAKLTAGDNIVIDENNTIKADGLATSEELAGVKATADAAAVATEVEDALALKANAADVYSKTEADELLLKKADLADVYKKTETYTQTQVNELIGNIQSGGVDLQGYVKESTYNAGMALKADQTAVDAITTSLNNYKTEVSNTYATQTELAEVSAVADAAQTADEVSTAISTALNNYTTTTDMNAALDLKADKTQVAADIAAVEAVMATDAEVEAAITELDLGNTYAAKSYEARVEANETAISNINNGAVMQSGVTADVVAQVTTNKNAIAANAEDIKDLQESGFVVGTKNAGSYLVNFDANGVASYAAIQVLGADGQPVDLTTGAVK